MNQNLKSILSILFNLFLAGIGTAQDATWTGSGDGVSWTDALNWDIGMEPADTHNVYISDDTVLFTGTGTIKSLTLTNALLSNTFGSKFVIDSSTGIGINLIASSLEVGGQLQVETSQSFGITVDATSGIAIALDGSLFIDDVSSATSIQNLGTISIHGSINITNGVLGIDNQDSIYMNGSLVINAVSTRGINNSHKLFNDSSGHIMIWDVAGFSNGAIQNMATIRNDGEIFIYSSEAGGLHNVANSSVLTNNGLIKMTNLRATSQSLKNQGELTNNGICQLYKLKSNGILNEGSMAQFNNNHFIDIDSLNAYGIKNSNGASFLTGVDSRLTIRKGLSPNANGIENQSAFINNGLTIIQDSMFHGLFNTGATAIFTNTDSLHIQTASRGIFNSASGQIINQSSGHIDIMDIGGSPASQGINNKSIFENWGKVEIRETDVVSISNNTSSAEFVNHGILEIANAFDFGIDNETGSLLNNKNTGTIHIHHILQNEAVQSAAITSNGLVHNGGKIRIEAIEGSGIISGDSLINTDSILIDSVDVDGMVCSGPTRNEATGFIQIDNSGENGLVVSDSLVNKGEMHIENAYEIGITNVNGLGFLENHNLIRIDNAGQHGLLNEIASTLLNLTGAQIQIQYISGTPLEVEIGSLFYIDGILEVFD
jgi:hypothetical protein